MNRHKQLPDTSVYQSGKEGGRDGAEQGPGSEAGQTQIGGAGYAVPSFAPQPYSSVENRQEVQRSCWDALGQEHRGEMEGLKVLGLLVLATQRPGTGLCLHSSYRDDSQAQGR